jgi:hypothetical protein
MQSGFLYVKYEKMEIRDGWTPVDKSECSRRRLGITVALSSVPQDPAVFLAGKRHVNTLPYALTTVTLIFPSVLARGLLGGGYTGLAF